MDGDWTPTTPFSGSWVNKSVNGSTVNGVQSWYEVSCVWSLVGKALYVVGVLQECSLNIPGRCFRSKQVTACVNIPSETEWRGVRCVPWLEAYRLLQVANNVSLFFLKVLMAMDLGNNRGLIRSTRYRRRHWKFLGCLQSEFSWRRLKCEGPICTPSSSLWVWSLRSQYGTVLGSLHWRTETDRGDSCLLSNTCHWF